jgi:hypothetical protein
MYNDDDEYINFMTQVKAMERAEHPLRLPSALHNTTAARHSFLYARSGTPQCVQLRERLSEKVGEVVGVLWDEEVEKRRAARRAGGDAPPR